MEKDSTCKCLGYLSLVIKFMAHLGKKGRQDSKYGCRVSPSSYLAIACCWLGNLEASVIAQLAPRYKGWLYLNPAATWLQGQGWIPAPIWWENVGSPYLKIAILLLIWLKNEEDWFGFCTQLVKKPSAGTTPIHGQILLDGWLNHQPLEIPVFHPWVRSDVCWILYVNWSS